MRGPLTTLRDGLRVDPVFPLMLTVLASIGVVTAVLATDALLSRENVEVVVDAPRCFRLVGVDRVHARTRSDPGMLLYRDMQPDEVPTTWWIAPRGGSGEERQHFRVVESCDRPREIRFHGDDDAVTP